MVFFVFGPFPFFSALLSIFSPHSCSNCHLASSTTTRSSPISTLISIMPLSLLSTFSFSSSSHSFVVVQSILYLLASVLNYIFFFFFCFPFVFISCVFAHWVFFSNEYLDISGYFHPLVLDFLWFFHLCRFTPHHRSIWSALRKQKYGTLTPFVFHYIHSTSSKLKLIPLLDCFRSLSLYLPARIIFIVHIFIQKREFYFRTQSYANKSLLLSNIINIRNTREKVTASRRCRLQRLSYHAHRQ